jgi:hypothetical protein
MISAVLVSCQNNGPKSETKKTVENSTAEKIEFAALASNPAEYVGKDIIVEGKVVHVCTETGKKLFIVGDNPDVRLYVAAGENISKFPMELLGSQIIVEGKITMPAKAATGSDMKEGKMKEGEMPCCKGGEGKMEATCETEKALAVQTTLSDVVMEYKTHTVKQ